MHYHWKQIVKESIGPLTLAVLFSMISGISLDSGLDLKELASILIIVPAFINISGDLSAVVAARISTDMYMGKRRTWLNVGGAMLVGLILYTFLALVAWGFLKLTAHVGNLVEYLEIVLVAGLLSLGIMITIAVTLENIGKRLNMDPSDLSIPLLSSVGDAVGVSLLIFIAKMIMGV